MSEPEQVVALKKKHDLPFLERKGVNYLNRLSAETTAVNLGEDDPIHVLNDTEYAALSRTLRWGVIQGLGIGALAGLLSAIVEIGVEGGSIQTFGLPHIVMIGIITVVVTAIEIACLYKICLVRAHALARDAGVCFAEQDDPAPEHEEMARALARAALELPNPIDPVFGINPHGEISKTWIVFVTLMYKLKVGMTNFVCKVIMRRFLGRFGLRYLAALVAIPVVALWDAFVCWKVLTEARIRAIGPSAAREFAIAFLDPRISLTQNGKKVIVGTIAATVITKADMHPNLVIFLREVVDRVGVKHTDDEYSSQTFLTALADIPPDEQIIALRILCASVTLDGRQRRREKHLLVTAYEVVGLQAPLDAVSALAKSLSRGYGITEELLEPL